MQSLNDIINTIEKMTNPQLNLTIQQLSEHKDPTAKLVIDICKKQPIYKRLDAVERDGQIINITHKQ